MEIFVEEHTDPHDNELAIMNLSIDKIQLLKKRGFFPTESNLIDDTYYTKYKELKRFTHLKGRITVQQLIDMTYNEMERVLFMKDSISAMDVVTFSDSPKWSDSFGICREYYDANPLCLEPYIAKYVRAINRCGMETFYSCDGWHEENSKSRETVIRFRDRYSRLWHKQLCEHSKIKKLCFWRYVDEDPYLAARIHLPHSDEQKLDVFHRLLKVGDLFVSNCKVIRNLKEEFITKAKDKEMDSLSDNEVEIRFGEYLANSIKWE